MFDRMLTELARRQSRRSALARIGAGAVGVATVTHLMSGKANADCSTCGGCGGVQCGAVDQGCCPSCAAYQGNWCDTGSFNCPSGYTTGWNWWCCNGSALLDCIDCCIFGGGCTNRYQTPIAC